MVLLPIEKGSHVIGNSGISRRAVATFIILLILCGLAVCFLVERNSQFEHLKMEKLILNQSYKIADVLTVYPLKGNEAVLGLNFFEDGAGNQEAREARDTGRLVLGGPFTLVQGGQALVGRLPVYLDDGKGEKLFWGLISVSLKFPQALDATDLGKLSELGLAYEIWRISPETNEKQVIAHSASGCGDDAPYIEVPLAILNADWFFRISPIKLWHQYPQSWLYISLGVLISFLLAMLVQHNLDLRRIRSQLENAAYHDPLTGILNRRGLFERLPGLISVGKSFSL